MLGACRDGAWEQEKVGREMSYLSVAAHHPACRIQLILYQIDRAATKSRAAVMRDSQLQCVHMYYIECVLYVACVICLCVHRHYDCVHVYMCVCVSVYV